MSLAQVFGLISLDEEDSKISIKWNYPKRSKWSWMLGHLKREKLTHPYKILLWVDCIHSTNIDQDMFIWTIEENVASIWVHNPYNDKCDFFFFFFFWISVKNTLRKATSAWISCMHILVVHFDWWKFIISVAHRHSSVIASS